MTRRLRDKLQSIRKTTNEFRSCRHIRNATEKEDSANTSGGDEQQVPGTCLAAKTTTLVQRSGFEETDLDQPKTNNPSNEANIPIGLFDLDTTNTTWAYPDPSLFTGLTEIL
jgi:hypothetical protein